MALGCDHQRDCGRVGESRGRGTERGEMFSRSRYPVMVCLSSSSGGGSLGVCMKRVKSLKCPLSLTPKDDEAIKKRSCF
jgi:hypothetical protein